MTTLKPQPPFVWPEPRALGGVGSYDQQPTFGDLATTSRSLFGIVSAITSRGVETLENWMSGNPDLRIRLVLMVYPACATRGADLARLAGLAGGASDRLTVHVRPLARVTDRPSNVLCFHGADADAVFVVVGPTEDLGLNAWQDGQVNLVFRADPVLVESLKRAFDWWWAKGRRLTEKSVAAIPDLVLPQGTEEAARRWQNYMHDCIDAPIFESEPRVIAHVDPLTGDVTLKFEDGNPVTAPTEDLGVKKLDQLAEQVARLYQKGALVSVDKLSRIPPLDAPLSPSLFGDAAELRQGNVTRRVNVRVSIIEEAVLKEIEKRRTGLRDLLTKFTYGLADNTRWMPTAAKGLFDGEVERLAAEGQKLVANLLKGDVDTFVGSRRDALVADINAMHKQLGRPGELTEEVVARVVDGFKDRLRKAQTAKFASTLTYTPIAFSRADSGHASPWGMAFSFLAAIVAFPRQAMTNSYFFRGLRVRQGDLIDAMNVADDAVCRDRRARDIEDRCAMELELLDRIKKAAMEPRDRCELAWRILTGDKVAAIEQSLGRKEAT